MPDAEVRTPRRPIPFDWRSELARQERNIPWLARHSGIHWRTLYRLHNGEQQPTDAQLVAIARGLGMAGPDGADL